MRSPILNQKHRTLLDRIALSVMTSLALTCLVFGVASYFRLIVLEPFDPAKCWCVLVIRSGKATWSYSSSSTRPRADLIPPGFRPKYEQIGIALENTRNHLALCENRVAALRSETGESEFGVKFADPLRSELGKVRDIKSEWSVLERLFRTYIYCDGRLIYADVHWKRLDPFQFVCQIHLAIPFVLFALYPLYRLVRFVQHRCRLKRIGKCVQCGYDLTGNVSGVCPECGVPVRSAPDRC